ncbi:MAG: hypothetical protein GF416_06540 [Candidatus Altiarchaeales archaeon]|nr:hypothetical protein [Candidatus Altiarchaeales archaeon]MBD3416773.1 hypothetical protein [Candidatus Altiarchaeales archaeon]
MRIGFDQHCPDCIYAGYTNMLYGKCYCKKFRMMVSRKRFPPPSVRPQKKDVCEYFSSKSRL